MLAVWCRYRPADHHLCIFQHAFRPPVKVDVQKRPFASVGISRRPQTASIGSEVDAADSGPRLGSHRPLGTVFSRLEVDGWVLLHAIPSRSCQDLPVWRQAPVIGIWDFVLDSSLRQLLASASNGVKTEKR